MRKSTAKEANTKHFQRLFYWEWTPSRTQHKIDQQYSCHQTNQFQQKVNFAAAKAWDDIPLQLRKLDDMKKFNVTDGSQIEIHITAFMLLSHEETVTDALLLFFTRQQKHNRILLLLVSLLICVLFLHFFFKFRSYVFLFYFSFFYYLWHIT